jgi:hypothetical protein
MMASQKESQMKVSVTYKDDKDLLKQIGDYIRRSANTYVAHAEVYGRQTEIKYAHQAKNNMYNLAEVVESLILIKGGEE